MAHAGLVQPMGNPRREKVAVSLRTRVDEHDSTVVPSLLERHRRVLPHWVDQMHEEPISLVSGDGAMVTDADGREYLDFFGGITTIISGHNLAPMVEAVRDQIGRIAHSSTLYLIEPMVELAELLVSMTPDRHEKVFFVNSGSEAVDTALMLATNHRGSNQVISMRQGYHGRSFGAVAVTGQRGYSASSLSPLDVQFASYGGCFHCPFSLSYPSCDVACATDLRNVIEAQTAGPIAALIVEPIQGVNGFVTPPPEFLPTIRSICDEYDILLVSDEVQTGFGRTGQAMWGIEAAGVEADLMVMAKGLGNGLPIAAVVGPADVMDAMGAGSISTFGGNHLVTAGALANLRYLIDNDLMTNARVQGDTMASALTELAGRHPEIIGEVRGVGLMQAVEFADPDRTPRPDLAAAVQEACKAAGLLIGKGGVHWNVSRLAPALIVDDAQIREAMEILAAAVATVAGSTR
ncbi:MAG: aspartate aminotransferase family protein [Acidimicrobiia bacterium]|nr:aspartate aminotransferase family protein [Acidimicrobiia bacterium]